MSEKIPPQIAVGAVAQSNGTGSAARALGADIASGLGAAAETLGGPGRTVSIERLSLRLPAGAGRHQIALALRRALADAMRRER